LQDQNAVIPAIIMMKPILVFPAPLALETPKLIFESPPMADFQKTDFYNENC
jgi:hypothetical protein